MEKPTVEQTAWVFHKLIENAGEGSFRYLIYDRMGYESKDYQLLYEAGGMGINNALDIIKNESGILGKIFAYLFFKSKIN